MALYGLIGDIHGNLEALTATFSALEGHRPEQLLCVGDIVGYNADPDVCAALLRERGAKAIAGNHDLISIDRLGIERCSTNAMHSLRRTRRRLHPSTAEYLRSLPTALRIEDRVVLVHGGVRDVQQYMIRPHHIKQNVPFLRADFPGRRICFYGHMHEQRVFEIGEDGTVRELPIQGPVRLLPDREYFVNPGSVDASRKRGVKLAEFALFDSGALTVEFFRVPYDDALTESKAAESGYRMHPLWHFFYSVQRRILLMLGPHKRG
jgi:diadenosine tetraphosphatase ApaH/serine/threonine PP2A family protein phosphatase